MNREMFDANLLAKQDEALKMDKKRDERMAAKAAIEAEIAEIEGQPESGKEAVEDKLSFDQFKNWLKGNGLAEKIPVIEEQINDQEKFYADVADQKFDRSKFFIEKDRLPAIKKGFEVGCINFCEVVDTTEKGDQMSEAGHVFEKLVEPLEAKGFKIWEKSGTERWTKLELKELLQRGVPVEPNEVDNVAFKNDWVKEESRILDLKKAEQPVGGLRLVFMDSRSDVPSEQKIVNKTGEVVFPENSSYIETVANNIRVTSRTEDMVLASYLFWKNKEYLARNTWGFNRDFVDHRDKGTDPGVSVANVVSFSFGFYLSSDHADYRLGSHRRRVAL